MKLPAALLEAISAPGGGKITLVVGAGCSFEPPTSIPVAKTCSQQCHDRLVASGVLADGDCLEPSNLSCLADAVFAKTGSQKVLVDQLRQHYTLKAASPNEGHLIAAALLREGAIASVVTLNFDLALSTAVAQLSVGDRVGIIDGPDELGNLKTFNVFYLHRNANTVDPDAWILRTESLKSGWTGQWEQVVAARVLATPLVLFVGIGNSADVLVQSSKMIQHAIPDGSQAYQINPGDPDTSDFFKALGLHHDFYLKGKWGEFMNALSRRLVAEHTVRLLEAAEIIVNENQLTPENLASLLDGLREIGILGLGALRANWLLIGKRYLAEELLTPELIADLLLTAALVARTTDTVAFLFEDGRVEFRRKGRTVATHLLVSGRGTRSRNAIEADLSLRRSNSRNSAVSLAGAIVSGTTGNAEMPITPPPDVVLGDTSESIIHGQSRIPIFHADNLRKSAADCRLVAP
jgi:hypothetical protein